MLVSVIQSEDDELRAKPDLFKWSTPELRLLKSGFARLGAESA
jgi:hypothetical protein